MRQCGSAIQPTHRTWESPVGIWSAAPFLSSLKDDKQIKTPFSRKAYNEYKMALKQGVLDGRIGTTS